MKYIYLILFFLLFTGCGSSQSKLETFFQTDNATHIKRDYLEIISLLLEYKHKLDIRNPNNFDKRRTYYIEEELKNSTNNLFLPYEEKYLHRYDEYLKVAFSPQKIKDRNDYLILGLYKQIYRAYEVEEEFQITTLTYEIEKLKELYYSLMVINWEIKTKKDKKGDFLFITWQNNWQIELDKRLRRGEKISSKMLQNLKYIKNKKESLLSKSNCNFEILISKMLYCVKNSLRIMGEEPLDIGLEAAKSLVFFL